MNGTEGVAAPSGVDRRQGASGASLQPRRGVLGDRRVSEMTEAGPVPSPIERQATPEGASEKIQGLASRDVGRVEISDRPYRLPELPVRFEWQSAYEAIKRHHAVDVQAGDTYAAAASAAALRLIDGSVSDAYMSRPIGINKLWYGESPRTERALAALRRARETARRHGAPARREAAEEAIDHIYRLTHAMRSELALRSREFAAASPRAGPEVPSREALGAWLEQQGEAADASSVEHRYFTQLADRLTGASDPWTVSRRLVESLPGDNADQAARLQAVHGRFVHAMAGQTPAPSGRGAPELPAEFKWQSVYDVLKSQHILDAQGSDIYATAASAAALRHLDRAVADAYRSHQLRSVKSRREEPRGLESMMSALRRMRRTARTGKQPVRAKALEEVLEGIYQLTNAMRSELADRSRECATALHRAGAVVPSRESLGAWLEQQADAADPSSIEHRYLTELAKELAGYTDPWAISRRLLGSLPGDNADQVARLQAAHGRLVQAMAGNLSHEPAASGSGDTELPARFRWQPAYRAIKSQRGADAQGGDFYAAAGSAAALRRIDGALADAYRSHRLRIWGSSVGELPDPESAMTALRRMRETARKGNQPARRNAVEGALDGIYRLTRAMQLDLEFRGSEFAMVSSHAGAAVPSREALGMWLKQQADAADASSIEHRYFTQLASELAGETDPWAVSRGLLRSLPGDNADQEARLQAAHGRLVRAMAGVLPAASSRPASAVIVAPVSGASEASALSGQQILRRLFRGKRMSEGQVQAILAGVAQAIRHGTLGASTSDPEAWAAGLLERIQENVATPWDTLTELEKQWAWADWTRLWDLIRTLEGAGHLLRP